MEKLKLVYGIKQEEWLECYDLFYSLYRKKWTYIKAGIFVIPLALFIFDVIAQPSFTMGWVCIVVCLGAIAAILATPKLDRRNTEHALEALKDDRYQFTLFDDRIEIGTVLPENEENYLDRDADGNPIPEPEIRPVVIKLSEKSFQVIETENIFALITKEMSYAVPKAGLSVYELETLRDLRRKPEKTEK